MNKVYSLLAAAFCLVAFSCAKQEIDNPASVGKTTRVKVKASIELPAGMTKSTISGSSFLWSEYDQIACYTTTGSFQNSDPLESEGITGAGQSARFWFSLTGTNPYLKDVAVFPVFPDKKPTYDTSTKTLTIKIPDTIAWVDGEVDNIEVAYFGGSSLTQNINLNFVNVAGVIKFTLNNLPVGANQVFFKTGKTITGDFVIENLNTKWYEYTSQQYDNLYISAGAVSDTDGITFTFDEVKEAGTSKVFYVPVPTGTYSQIGFKVQNNDGQTVTNLWKKTATVSNTVGRGTMLVMPALTFASATGGGEGNPTNIITTLSGQTGAVALPSTTESVLVEMNTTAGALDLEYADGGEKPANVYVKVLTDATVNTLNIDLPNSTVYVNGLDNSNVGTLSSVTAESTLKVLASPLTIGKATINQGNVEIGGTVNSVVVAEGATSDGKSAGAANQVRIFVTKEAALQTITLNAKTDVVVEQPKDNIDAAATENKVYVIVNAVGSSATAQNGGDIYVTANADCSVTADGVDPEDNTNKSTAKIENNTGSESGVATVTEDGGEISTGAVSKAKIGNVEYETLAAAITAANANDEIVILVDQTVKRGYTIDKDLTINLNGKTLTANAVSDSDSNFTNNNNRLFHVEGSDIDFTINNGTIVLDEHIWGTVRFISQGGNLALTDVTTYNFREWGANIKLSYGHAAFNNVIMHSDKGGCVDIGDGASESAPSGATAEMTNCIFDQTNEGSIADDHISVSSAIITSYSGHVTLNSGTYSAYYALFPHSSGGTITVKDGCTITGRHNAVHTTKHGHTSTQEDHCIYIQGGTINGAFDVATDGHTTFSVTGGTFDHDPSAYVATGYIAVQNGDLWTVEPLGESNSAAKIGTTYYATLVEAIDAVAAGQTITLTSDLDFSQAPYDVYKWAGSVYNPLELCVNNVTIDLNGHTISEMGNSALAIGHLLAKDGRISNLTVKNGTLLAGKTDNVTNSYVLLIAGVDGMTVKNVTTNGGINVCSGSADVVIEDCTINGTKYYTVCSQTGSEVTIKGTTYTKNTDATVANKSMFWIHDVGTDSDMETDANPSGAFGASSITIEDGNYTVDFSNGGVFYLTSALAPTLKGGTYNFDPSAYCAAGYAATQSGNVWTVAPVAGVAAIGSVGYETLAAAVEAAQDGQTVTILQAGSYSIPDITKNLAIDAAVSGVVVEHTDNTTIATIASGKTATFKNITFNLGDTQNATLHGFGTSASSGALVMDGCTINGALSLFGVSTFTNCTFAVSGTTKYNIWSVNSDASFTGCSFTNTNRAVNVYDRLHGSVTKNVSFSNCSFAGTEAKKAAINVHHNPDNLAAGAKYAVSINNCTTTGTWASSTAQTGEAETTICNNALWMVSDLKNYVLGDITISVDGVARDLSWGAAKIGTTCYPTLAEAVSAVGTNETITLLDNVALSASETTLHFKDKSFNINGAKTIDLSASTQKYPWWFENGTFNLSDITVTSTGHDYAVLFTKSDGNSNGTLNNVAINSIAETALCFDESNSFTLNGVTVSQTGSNSTDWRNVAVATSGGATVTIESGSYSSENGWAVRHFSSGGNITINGGTFSGKIKAHLDKGSYSKFPAIITINGGTFTNCTLEVEHNNGDTTANIVINGGTFDCDPTTYLGAGHTATHSGNTWTVQ